ncbi:hypothetical protein Poli38472_002317 [Pythium oligandrum]|uniref:1-phosphatidylinositol-3-phosphate 5-kinase n=1 Tax=Pythium oligandrum TaxID=41045 RepID=A0A8K1FI32_PYTOL|nr:hypothetical protein Poli38472_002317 [Pythium oligandrum]|eukprot:TMW63376.1 hypothetical protein Poli38472_002317 [Pythium oligandrum]
MWPDRRAEASSRRTSGPASEGAASARPAAGDPAGMTAFPRPGFYAPSIQLPKDLRGGTPNQILVPDAPVSLSHYWMPDHLCKVCYDCGASFSLFRRRHHCRLCGQIFCYDCSNQFIDGVPHGFPGMIRICNFCAHYVKAVDVEKKKPRANSVVAENGGRSRRGSLAEAAAAPLPTPSAVAAPVSSPLLFSPVNLGASGTLFRSETAEDLDSSLVEETSDSPDMPPVIRIQTSDTTDTADVSTGESATSGPMNPRARRSFSRRRRSSVELMDAIENSGVLELDDDIEELEEPTGNRKRPSFARDGISFRFKDDMHTQREIVLDKFMHTAHERIRVGIRHSVDRVVKHFVDDKLEVKRLVKTLEDMTFIVTGHLLFSMNYRSPNGFNYDRLVKVKSISTAESATKKGNDRYNFTWLGGCVCHKHLSHKQMSRQISNPRILLLACGISYDRSSGTGKLSSLDTLIEQEKSYMSILVEKISTLEPDVIFVERTVSRHAQELLRERGVAIVLNVKHDTLERIGRHTGAVMLTSVDHVDKMNPADVIGTCRSFYVKSFGVTPDDDPAAVSQRTEHPVPARARNETYLYLDGCDPLNGCTVLITGPSKLKLRLMKSLMRNVVAMAYRLLLEAHVLSDLNISVSDSCFQSLFDGKERVTWCTTSTLRINDSPHHGKPRHYQCSGSKHIGIPTYSDDDLSLGNFLAKEMEAVDFKCNNPKCNYAMIDHVQTFNCRIGMLTVSFEELPDDDELTSTGGRPDGKDINILTMLKNPAAVGMDDDVLPECPTIVFWRWCRECNQVISPFVPMKKYAYKYSLARLLEVFFVEEPVDEADYTHNGLRSPRSCSHDAKESHVLFFNVGDLVARFDFSRRVATELTNAMMRPPHQRRRSSGATRLQSEVEKLEKQVNSRNQEIRTQLDSIVTHFSEKMESIQKAVESCEEHDELYTTMLVAVASVQKLMQADEEEFITRLHSIDDRTLKVRLVDLAATQRALYFMACRWIEEILKLRKLIKSNLARDSSGSFLSASPFNFSFSTPTSMSPAPSPRQAQALSPKGSFRDSTDLFNDRRGRLFDSFGTDVSSINGSEIDSVVTSSSISTSESNGKPPVAAPAKSRPYSLRTDSEKSGWRSVLYDIYRVLGKSTPGDDYDFQLPQNLLECHPSLPCRSDDQVVLVNDCVPITFIAYALGSESYEEQSAVWRYAVHQDTASTLAQEESESLDTPLSTNWSRSALESAMSVHFKHTVADVPQHSKLMGSSGSALGSEFSMVAYCPLQFQVLRELFYGNLEDFIFSIAHVNNWAAVGGKSGAAFYRTLDDRFIVKHISSTEFQSFLDVLPSYFKYMAEIYFDSKESVLSKTVGMYQTTFTRRDTGQKVVNYVIVMENAFYRQSISRIFDLKGSSRNRYVRPVDGNERSVQLDGNFTEFMKGLPLGILAEDYELLSRAVQNDTTFLRSTNIVDFSLVVGFGPNSKDKPDELSRMTVGIIDYLRQFDFIKRVESVSKSVGMIAGQSSPTIIEPALYCKRFVDAMHRYFMPVTPISSNRNEPRSPQ